MNRFERFAAQLVDTNEKLLDVAKDDRRFRAPAIRIRMMKFFFAQKHPALAKQFDKVWICVEHIFAGQIRQAGLIRKPAVIIDGR